MVFTIVKKEEEGRSRKGSTFTVLCIRKYLKEMRMFHKSVVWVFVVMQKVLK